MKKIIAALVLSAFFSSVFGQSLTANRLLNSSNRSSKATENSAISDSSNRSSKATENSAISDSALRSTSGDIDLLIADPQLAMSMPNYQVTAGDVYTLAFAMGSSPVSFSLPVDSTYRLRVANMGILNCKGLTFNELKSQVESLVSKNYPMGGVQFVLTAPSVFLISISGEVNETTERKAWALTRLSAFISSSLTDYSSLRSISVISEDGGKKDFDLYKAKRDGDFSQDPYLRPGDKIVINRIDRKVTLEGLVERPGEYEILPGENLKDLIEKYGGGLVPLADTTRIELYRLHKSIDGAGMISYLTEKDIESNYPLYCYDKISIPSYEELKDVMYMQGAVGTGIADPEKQTTVKIAVRFYVGKDYAVLVREYRDLFTAASDLQGAYIIRTENGEEKHVPLQLQKMLYDSDYYSTEMVQKGDILLVPFKLFYVTVSGAVAKPGRFPYIPDRDWRYYVGLAGGIDSSKNSREKMDILAPDGSLLDKDEYILPETTIDVKENSFWYKWNKVAPTVTTLLSIVSTTLAIIISANALSK